MDLLSPEHVLLELVRKYANTAYWEKASLSELKSSIDRVDCSQRCHILANKFNGGKTILHRAAAIEDAIDVFRLVIDSVSVENKLELLKVQDSDGCTPLHRLGGDTFNDNIQHVLAGISHDDVTQLLKIGNEWGFTLLHLKIGSISQTAFDFLLSHLNNSQIFELFAMQCNDYGYTVLHQATCYSKNAIERIHSKLSLENYIHLLETKTNDGETPLHLSCGRWRSEESLKGLLEHKSLTPDCIYRLLQIEDNKGKTPLHTACDYNRPEHIKYMFTLLSPEHRLQLLRSTDNNKKTPLHYIAKGKHPELVGHLLADISPKDRVELLSMKDKYQNTILSFALKRKQVKFKLAAAVIECIPSESVSDFLNRPISGKKTAIDIAVAKGHTHTIEKLKKHAESRRTQAQPATFASVAQTLMVQDTPTGYRLATNGSTSNSTVEVETRPPSDPLPPPSLATFTAGPESLMYQPEHQSSSAELSYPVDNLQQVHQSFENPVTSYQEWAPPDLRHSQSTHVATFTTPFQPSPYSTLINASAPPAAPPTRKPHETSEHDSMPTQRDDQALEHFSDRSHTSQSTSIQSYIPDVVKQHNQEQQVAQAGGKRSSSQDIPVQPKRVANEVPNEGQVNGHILKVRYQGRGHIFSFKPNTTVCELVRQIEKKLEVSCSIDSPDGFNYSDDVTLDLIAFPFEICLNDDRVLVSGENNGLMACGSTQADGDADFQKRLKKFGRVTNVQEVVDLLSFVHKQMKEGKTVNGALKLAKKSRKTIDRFRNIYYLHTQDRDKMEELETAWKDEHRQGGLQELDTRAKNKINWDQLEKLFDNGSVADFTVRRQR